MPDTVFHPLPKVGDRVQQVVMPLIMVEGNEVIPLGTGFTITSDGLMVTARHVIEEAEKRERLRTGNRRISDLRQDIFALYMIAHHADGRVCGGTLPVRKVWLSDEFDICYCLLSGVLLNNEPVRFPVVRLSPGLPRVGENVIGFGYLKMAGTLEGTLENGQTQIKYKQDTAFTRGQITEVYPLRRNSLLPFPSFRTNARFDPGMSGGPVMNERGSVCGVICNSLPADDEYPEHISNASLLYPALGTLLDVASQPGSAAERMSVYDVIQKGHILTDDTIADVSVQHRPDGGFSVSIKP
jgi:S1-C subfamily serine protease